MNCPVCGQPCKITMDYLDGHTLTEEYVKCEKGHWFYEYSYGGYEETIGDKTFYWSYRETEEEEVNREEQRRVAIEKARQNL